MSPKPVIEAMTGKPVGSTPVWMMRQAGRHLPEYRQVREKVSFVDAVSTPKIAAELTLQPIARYDMDAAIIFADIMTPLQAMGVSIDFDPGPSLRPHTLSEVASLGELVSERVDHVAETVSLVADAVPEDTAVIGFAGAPFTLLCYLLEGGGSKDFMRARAGLRSDPVLATEALDMLARAMNQYLGLQVHAGADAVQLFDSWVGVCDREIYAQRVAPAAATALRDLDVPTVYFAPGASHTLDLQTRVGAACHGVDWRIPIDTARDLVGRRPVQGNLDPAVLLTTPDTIVSAVTNILDRVGENAGHVFNLGHGVHPDTPTDNVKAMVEAVRR